ncbi:MAG: hydroxyacid dehydrogenase [Acidimicrobiales bacterium]|nr:hydroxyacid dehydrogenase [Acidimicrobiales bacterium]
MQPRIVLAHWDGLDFYGDAGMAQLAQVGEVLDREPLSSFDDQRADDLLARAEVLVGHWGCPLIDGSVIERAPDLGLIAYTAGTVKFTVTDDVFDRGIRITSGAPANAEPVAEFTLAAILFANKDVFFERDRMRNPSIATSRSRGDVPVGNWDKTVGIVGASMVGRRVIELLRPFPRLDVILYDPFVGHDEAARLGVRKLDLDDLCAVADVLSVHAPDIPSTRGMIGADQLAALRTGATLINTARGALVDHDALIAELRDGRLYAVLDVTDPEPLPDDNPLRILPNVFLTPHLAGSQGTELGRMTESVVDEIRRYAAGERAANEVTRSALDRIA